MSKFTDFFLGFKKRYDEQVIRNKNMDEFLKSAKSNFDKIGQMNTTVTNLDNKVANLETKVDNIQIDMNNMN